MNSKGHLYVSTLKSAIRISACIISFLKHSMPTLALGFLVAEVLGVIEELVDFR